MSFIGKIFGSGKEKTPTPQEAIQKLRETEEMLLKKSEFLEKKINQELATAKKAGTKNKRDPVFADGDGMSSVHSYNDEDAGPLDRLPPFRSMRIPGLHLPDALTRRDVMRFLTLVAMAALKRKKRLEKNLQQIDGTLSTIEFQREALENASTNTEVLKVMGHAAKALKGAHQNLDADKVHDLMDDVAEQHEISKEITEAISNPVGYNEDLDEDDLLAELEEMEQEELDKQLLEVGGETEDLPSVPTAEPSERAPAKAAKEEDDDMKELEMWAS